MTIRIPDDDAEKIMRDAGLEPLEPYPGAHQPWRCQCTACGLIVHPRLSKVRSGGRGCQTCAVANRKPIRRPTPEQAHQEMLDAGMEPLEPYPGQAGRPWPSRCMTCGTQGAPRLDAIRQGGGGCKPCGHKKTAASARTPETVAISDMRDAGMEPLEPFPGTHSPWRSQCLVCGTIGSPRLNAMRNGQGGCVPCGRIKSAVNRRIPEAIAIEEMLDAGMHPQVPYPGVDTPWPCVCLVCGEPGSPRLISIRVGQGGCEPCSYRRRGGARQLSETEAVSIMREHGFEPLEPYPGRNRRPWRSRCLECAEVSFPTLTNVKYGSGCRYCCHHGFDWGAPAFVYLVTHRELRAHKVGIANVGSDRLLEHKRQGWQVVYASDPLTTGIDAYTVEQAVLRRIFDEFGAARNFLPKGELPQGGYTETFSAQAVSESELIRITEEEIRRQR